MQLRAEGLSAHLSKGLARIYTVHGDEPLLAQEAGDQIRAAAKAQGFGERQIPGSATAAGHIRRQLWTHPQFKQCRPATANGFPLPP